MIDRLTTNYRPAGITEAEQPQTPTAPITKESPQTPSSSTVVQESKLAYAKRGESAFSGSMQRATLDAALNVKPGTAPEVSAPVGTAPGVGETAGSEKVLKPGDVGIEVENFQTDMNRWRRENGLPEISATGVFTKETEDSVKEFQRLMNLKDDGIGNVNTTKRLEMENSESFKELDSEVKNTIRNAFSSLQNDPVGRDNLLEVIHDRHYRYLISPDAQKAAINGFMQDPSYRDMPAAINRFTVDVAILEKDTNYQSLPDEIKHQVLNTMSFKIMNGGLAAGGRNNVLADLASNPNFGKRPLSQQKQMLDTVAANPDAFTANDLRRLLDSQSFQSLDSAMQAQVIDIAHNNALHSSNTGQQPNVNDVSDVTRLNNLVSSAKFKAASDEEKKAMLEAERKTITYALGEK